MRRNFAWSLVGNIVYNLTQWLLLVALARLGSPVMVGQFALALAVSAPVYLTIGLNLRAVRATDVRRVYDTREYHRLRLMLNALSLMVTVVIGLVIGLRGEGLAVLAIVGLGKATEATSQTLYGYFQVRERLDLVARSLLLRAAIGAAGFVSVLYITRSLPGACAGLLGGWLLTYLLHDARQERTLLTEEPDEGRTTHRLGMLSLARKAAPLGIDAGVGSLATNAPRYTVQVILGTAQLGVFASLAYLGQVVSMITGALADTAISRLAKLADRGDRTGFKRLLARLLVFGAVVAVASAIAAATIGSTVVTWLMGAEYADRSVLVLVMLGAGAVTVQRCLGRGLQALHRYRDVLWVDSVTLLATVVVGIVLISRWGLDGAAATLGLGFAFGSLFAILRLRKAILSVAVPA